LCVDNGRIGIYISYIWFPLILIEYKSIVWKWIENINWRSLCHNLINFLFATILKRIKINKFAIFKWIFIIVEIINVYVVDSFKVWATNALLFVFCRFKHWLSVLLSNKLKSNHISHLLFQVFLNTFINQNLKF
jgi:hypothetical protein